MTINVSNSKKTRSPKIHSIKTLDTRNHGFNVGIAIDFNPEIALFLGHLAFWAEKNLANNKHIHDGLVWSYDTLEALGDIFPYFSKRQLETIINNCVEYGLIKKGNFNKTLYDRTCWYALTEKSYFYFPHLLNKKYIERLNSSISQNCEMDITELGNRFPKNVTPIPDTDPDTDPMSVGDSSNPSTHKNLKKSKKEKTEEKTLKDADVIKTFEDKFLNYDITIEKLFKSCQEHYEQKNLWVTKDKFLKWILSERLDNYKKVNQKINTTPTKQDFENYKKCIVGYEWVGIWLQQQQQKFNNK